jgi:hypothetical protein
VTKPVEPTAEQMLERMRLTAERGQQICERNEYENYTRGNDGRDACLARMGFNVAIFADLTEWGYGERWCYSSLTRAYHALIEWKERGLEGEPEGWHRHPDTGRRRPDGDKAREYINP